MAKCLFYSGINFVKQHPAMEITSMEEFTVNKPPKLLNQVREHLRVVLAIAEVQRLLKHTQGQTGLILRLLYGTGMRLMEGCRLRLKDLDLARELKRPDSNCFEK